MSITENIEAIKRNIQAALSRRAEMGFTISPVKLVAVTKNQSAALICDALEAGIASVGENRVQEALGKQEEISFAAEWHLIGHLQTNKARQAVTAFELIHSVDSQRLALEIDKVAGKLGKRQKILLQVNAAGEETKFGISPGQLFELAQTVSSLSNLELCGLMTIAPYYDDPEDVRPVFRQMYELFTELRSKNFPGATVEWLSMGMTNDYKIAVEEGSNLVRIGTAIFGPRHY